MAEKLLIVDDEKNVRESMVSLLRTKGYDTEGAESGAAALQKIRSKSFDLLVLDFRMPGMDGLETFRRAKEINPEIVAIILTGYGTAEREIEGLRLGVKRFVRKPITPDQLANVINDVLAKARIKQ